MPTRESTPAGDPVWIDLMTSDTERARTFYGELFGWEADEPNEEFGGYVQFSKDGRLIGGLMSRMPDTPAEVPDMWSIYLSVDDAAKTYEVALGAGGTTIVELMQVGEFGTMACVIDPTGAAIGMWQAGSNKGFGVVGDPDTPGYFELHTRDHDAAVSYYTEVFGWADAHAVEGIPDFKYTTLGDAAAPRAGIIDASGFLPEGVPPHWRVYMTVADADATVAKAVELGGSVVQPAEDTPYGRLAVLADPMGAMFALTGPNNG